MTQDDKLYLMLGTVDALLRDLRSMVGAGVAIHLAEMLMAELVAQLDAPADLPSADSAAPVPA